MATLVHDKEYIEVTIECCIVSVAFSADGRRFTSGSGDRTVKVWDAATGACLQTLEIGQAIATFIRSDD